MLVILRTSWINWRALTAMLYGEAQVSMCMCTCVVCVHVWCVCMCGVCACTYSNLELLRGTHITHLTHTHTHTHTCTHTPSYTLGGDGPLCSASGTSQSSRTALPGSPTMQSCPCCPSGTLSGWVDEGGREGVREGGRAYCT